jgi:hypothetical protein
VRRAGHGGALELTTDRRGNPLGRLVYGQSYLARGDAVALDPVELKLSPRVYETTAMNGIFSVLRDAGPDYWGRLVIERHIGKAPLSDLDYLLHSPDDRAGALGFGLGPKPPAPKREFNQTINLAELQAIADAIINNEELPAGTEQEQVDQLLRAGTSMGGARPKTVVDDDGLWVAKFNRRDDRWNSARVEHAMLTLARACGLTTAGNRVHRITLQDHQPAAARRRSAPAPARHREGAPGAGVDAAHAAQGGLVADHCLFRGAAAGGRCAHYGQRRDSDASRQRNVNERMAGVVCAGLA